jgi:hypothetical protein
MDAQTIRQIADYFTSAQWMELIRVLEKTDEEVYHAHIYVDTQLNPLSMEELVKRYFAKIGRPIHRKIEIFTSGQLAGKGTIHGIEPEGYTHFDLLFGYSEDLPIKPASAKNPNVEYWGEQYMEAFHSKYPFQTELTAAQIEEVERYFESDAWKDYVRLNESDDVVHIHANVETSVHPSLIQKYALEAMRKQGWEIEYSCPVAFEMRGQMNGKLVFAGTKPEKMFDIAWQYNPAVTLIPSTRYWLTTESPTYDARTMREVPQLLKRHNFRLLTTNEIDEIADLMVLEPMV